MIAMKTQLIITHPGSAHFDEVTAISLLLAVHGGETFRIERREPTVQELNNPEVWVIDTGNRLEPQQHNFDHHQDANCPAAFVLIADYLGLTATLSVLPWWHFKDEVDRIGPVRSPAKYHAGDDLVNRSPTESWLVARFAADPNTAIPLLRDFGAHLIAEAGLLKKQVDFWQSCPRLVIAGVPAVIGKTVESAGLEEFRRLEKNPPDIVISMDRRSEGWRLFRFDGAPVDFSLIANRPEIAFAHRSGFLAKTKELLPIDELVALVSKAVIRA
jgi:hypothetical protein